MQWIESPFYDLAFFAAAPLIGLVFLLLLYGHRGSRFLLFGFFIVGMAHYVSTFSFYLPDENLKHYKSRAFAFFAGPLLILGIVAALRFGAGLNLLLSTIFLWNAWHVSLQSCGILSIYRHRSGAAASEKALANAAVISMGAMFLALSIDRFDPLGRPLAAVWKGLPLTLVAIATLCAAVAVPRCILQMRRRARDGKPPTIAEGIFLFASLMLFHPYAWVQNAELATAGMLIGHFVQYIALVWLLHRRKFAQASGSRHQHVLTALTRSPLLLAAALLTVSVGLFIFDRWMNHAGAVEIYAWLWNALVLTHFYLDGFIWSFKNPFVRQTMGPYLSAGYSTGSITSAAARLEPIV